MYRRYKLIFLLIYVNYFSDFSAEDFVNNLLNKGCDVICDDTSEHFDQQNALPSYYNEELYKRLVSMDGISFFPYYSVIHRS